MFWLKPKKVSRKKALEKLLKRSFDELNDLSWEKKFLCFEDVAYERYRSKVIEKRQEYLWELTDRIQSKLGIYDNKLKEE
jgi:hypothetical protein